MIVVVVRLVGTQYKVRFRSFRQNGTVQAGARKGWGRGKGTLNKRTAVRHEVLDRAYQAVIAELPEDLRNMTPLEALLLCMRWAIQAQDRNAILAAAAAAAPYVHAEIEQHGLSFSNSDKFNHWSDEELRAEMERLEAKIRAADNGEPTPPSKKLLPH